MTLPKHLLRIVGFRVLASLLVLVSILQILDLLDVTTDILERRLGVGGVLYYAFLRLPTLVQQVAPLSVLAGCLFAFAELARQNAVVALRSTGVSTYQLLGMMAPAALAVALLHLVSVQWLTPRADQALDAWWSRTAPKSQQAPQDPRSFRVGEDIVTATMGAPSGRRLTGVKIYRRDTAGRLVERLRADMAIYQGDGWRLAAPSFETLGPGGVQRGAAQEIVWRPGPQPQDVRAIFTGEESLAPGSARRALRGGVSTRPPAFYETAVQRAWSAPFAAFVMLLLTGPVLLVNFRSGGARTVVLCLAAGLLFLVIDGVFTALGESGTVPALLAAWAAPAIFASLGASALLFQEG
ncbi:LptF/LptG family permease [Phenylobacterium sp. LjRoot225]|uniref:LptF/LptG family permease n=1 Tax=Phenylobacterium sp. LjRoot225 TaxID=3342285 RepID=UPI003ECE1825